MSNKTIETKKFRDIFISTTRILDDTVSTIDHVFGSPPLRLIDSHFQLKKLQSATPILWDVTKPNIDKYRSELILDMGFLSLKDPKLFLYDLDSYYCLSKVKNVDFQKQKIYLTEIFSHQLLSDVTNEQKKLYLERLEKLVSVYVHFVKDREISSHFYKNLLVGIYRLIGFPDLADFVSSKMVLQFESGLIDKYIPELILNSKEDVYGYLYLLKETDLFLPPYFRPIQKLPQNNIDFYDRESVIKNIDEIIKLLKNKSILPHHTVYFWAWGVSGINHFGNDYGDFLRIENTFNNLNIKNEIGKLQLTKPKQDGSNFIVFSKTATFAPKLVDSKIKYNVSTTKSSRASNICTVFLNSGGKIKDFFNKYQMNKQITELDMRSIS